MPEQEVMSFEEALALSADDGPRHVLLGNGFSRACRDDIFAYGALFDRAEFGALSNQARAAFDALATRDFEAVIRALRSAATLIALYDPSSSPVPDRMREDGDGLREVLVRAIADSHPAWPGEIAAERYGACKRFLARFGNIVSVRRRPSCGQLESRRLSTAEGRHGPAIEDEEDGAARGAVAHER